MVPFNMLHKYIFFEKNILRFSLKSRSWVTNPACEYLCPALKRISFHLIFSAFSLRLHLLNHSVWREKPFAQLEAEQKPVCDPPSPNFLILPRDSEAMLPSDSPRDIKQKHKTGESETSEHYISHITIETSNLVRRPWLISRTSSSDKSAIVSIVEPNS